MTLFNNIRAGIGMGAILAMSGWLICNRANAQASQMLETSLTENGKQVRLEVVIFRPSGAGPFPLLVFNHGSTGNGKDASLFRRTFSDAGVASYFTAKGWFVAFPQRRGRGKSEGLYDEGFNTDRSLGYVCDNVQRSLAGAERALTDIDAVVEALRRRTDVTKGPLLMAGQSRGGALSIAYGGRHPDKVLGVINFVGGWMGTGCINASRINWGVFNIGARYPKDTLWLYADKDRFYSLAHSEINFDQFRSNGGKGEFVRFQVPSGDGHGLRQWIELWRPAVDRYVKATKAYPRPN